MNSVLLKFGKKEHLEGIKNGTIRFFPASKYIQMEEQTKIRGQGDRMEGKDVFRADKLMIDSGAYKTIIDNPRIETSYEGIEQIPILCLSWLNDGMNRETIEDICNCMRNEFKYSHVLVITQPELFIDEITSMKFPVVVGDKVRYFSEGDPRKQEYVLEEILKHEFDETKKGYSISIPLDETIVSRNLFCKDLFFSSQKEYRFISRSDRIVDPEGYVDYKFNITADMQIISISELPILMEERTLNGKNENGVC